MATLTVEIYKESGKLDRVEELIPPFDGYQDPKTIMDYVKKTTNPHEHPYVYKYETNLLIDQRFVK